MFVAIFFVVLIVNILPVFAPPTWMVLAYIQVQFNFNVFLLALVGTVAATIGRLILARLSTLIIRKRLLSERTRSNIDNIKNRMLEHKRLTIGILVSYALSPLPTNQLFLAYGLTDLPLKYIALPFFLGRFLSYLFWVSTVSMVTLKLAASKLVRGAYIGSYYVIVQILTLVVVYLFTRIDWQKLFKEKKLTLIKRVNSFPLR
jgi:MFS family permease